MVGTRLCIVTPPTIPADFDEQLEAALGAGDVASLLIDADEPTTLKNVAAIAMRRNVAAIVVSNPPLSGVDGVHIESGATAIIAARKVMSADAIIGAGGINSRHDAMLLGETEPDYVFFGRLDGDDRPSIHPKALDLARWWAELFEIPAIVMGGSDIASVAEAQNAGIEFVALRGAVWDHAGGAAAAVAAASALLRPESGE
jgi:thiamine-phosphate pyrophosphorylase